MFSRPCIVATILSTLTPIAVLGQHNPARMESVFPMFAQTSRLINEFSTEGFASEFEVMNPNDAATQLLFRFFNADGEEVLPAGGNVSITIPANGTVRLAPQVFRLDTDLVGWVRVTSDLPVILSEKIRHFFVFSGLGPVPPVEITRSPIIKPPAGETRQMFVRVKLLRSDGPFFSNTGIVIVAASPLTESPSSTQGTLILRNEQGEEVSQAVLDIPAGGQAVKFFTELFPEVEFSFEFLGSLEANFSGDVFVTAIQLTAESIEERMEEPASGTG